MEKKITIAVDGYSSCGKSTLAKDLAKKLDYLFIDSGAMYRAVTFFALENDIISPTSFNVQALINSLSTMQIDFYNAPLSEKAHILLNGRDVELEIRTPRVASFVSQIATIKEVRQKLVNLQQKMGESGGVIMDGRDIGSVVFPKAELKLFVTARPEVRAQRRFDELTSQGIETTIEDVLKNLLERDRIDSTRDESPLIQTDDAILIDTSDLTRESQVNLVLEIMVSKALTSSPN